VARVDPHDPGVEAAKKRAEETGDAASAPVKAGKGKVRFGTASWTDPTMTAPGVFYPPGAGSAEDRLRYYASRFPVVEVDSTYYALPNKRTSEAWAERTPKDFVFDIKAHALMTGQPTEQNRLPKAIKEELPKELKEKKRIYRKDVPEELLDAVYKQFREALEPLTDADLARTVTIRGEAHTVVQAAVRQVAHYAYHVGQILLIAKHLRGERWEYITVPPGGTAALNRKM
jgi:cation transport regulator ChaB